MIYEYNHGNYIKEKSKILQNIQNNIIIGHINIRRQNKYIRKLLRPNLPQKYIIKLSTVVWKTRIVLRSSKSYENLCACVRGRPATSGESRALVIVQ